MSKRTSFLLIMVIFLVTVSALAVASPGAARPAASPQVVYQAGAAKAAVTPPLEGNPVLWMAGYSVGRPAESVHDELFTRVIILDDGQTPMAFVTVDVLGLTSDDIGRIEDAIVAVVPELAGHILVNATHTHEAPDTIGLWGGAGQPPFAHPRPLAWIEYIGAQSAAAAGQAWADRAPVTFTLAALDHAPLDWLVNDSRDPQVRYNKVHLMVLQGANGTVATLVNWAMHPESMGSENTAITADFVKYLLDEVETQMGGMALMVNGAIGGLLSDKGGTFPEFPDPSFERTEAIGRTAAQIMLDHLNNPTQSDLVQSFSQLPPITYTTRRYAVPVENPLFLTAWRFHRVPKHMYRQTDVPAQERWRPADQPLARYTDFTTNFITFGPVSMLTYGGELYPELLVGGIERLGDPEFRDAIFEPPLIENPVWSPYTFKFLLGLTDDFTGYIPPVAEWDGWDGAYGEEFATSWDLAPIASYNMHLLMLGYQTGQYPATLPDFLQPIYDTYKP